MERSVHTGLRRDLPDCPGRRAETQRDHLRPLRGDALDRIQARPALGGQPGLPGDLRRRAGGRAAHPQRHQRGDLPRRARHRYRRGRFTPARQCQ